VGADLRPDIIINEHLARGVGRGFDPAQGQFSIGRLCGAETGVFWAILALFRPVGAVQAGWCRKRCRELLEGLVCLPVCCTRPLSLQAFAPEDMRCKEGGYC
jgi:hypothetical protein